MQIFQRLKLFSSSLVLGHHYALSFTMLIQKDICCFHSATKVYYFYNVFFCTLVFQAEVQRKKHQASKDHNAKWRARTIPSGTNSSKDCQRNGGQMHASSKSPKTMLDVGKSYTNRCVKEILKKLEHGSYSSRWYDFSSPNMPLPKWINFNWTESGGVLDAFLCKGNEDNHVCYLMDVRIGEKVGRLLKYPGPIRVGQNGYTSKAKCHKDSLYDFELEGLTLNDITSKKMKSRPFPLSWNEQFDWKDVSMFSPLANDLSLCRFINLQ